MTATRRPGSTNRGLNKLMLIGEIGRDPEMRYTAHGVPVTTFSMASSRTWVDTGGERQVATDWFNVVAWRHLAEMCHECLQKGARVYVEGRLQTRSFDVEDGSRQYQVEVVAQEMILLDAPHAAAIPEESEAGAEPGRAAVELDTQAIGAGAATDDAAADEMSTPESPLDDDPDPMPITDGAEDGLPETVQPVIDSAEKDHRVSDAATEAIE